MSTVKRWEGNAPLDISEAVDGSWVRWEDFQALERKVAGGGRMSTVKRWMVDCRYGCPCDMRERAAPLDPKEIEVDDFYVRWEDFQALERKVALAEWAFEHDYRVEKDADGWFWLSTDENQMHTGRASGSSWECPWEALAAAQATLSETPQASVSDDPDKPAPEVQS